MFYCLAGGKQVGIRFKGKASDVNRTQERV